MIVHPNYPLTRWARIPRVWNHHHFFFPAFGLTFGSFLFLRLALLRLGFPVIPTPGIIGRIVPPIVPPGTWMNGGRRGGHGFGDWPQGVVSYFLVLWVDSLGVIFVKNIYWDFCDLLQVYTPWKEVWFQWFSFSIGWFSGFMLILRSVTWVFLGAPTFVITRYLG